ncbi:MAG TPA: heme-binding domain-containing protein [Candidatus Angelobacter sp.]
MRKILKRSFLILLCFFIAIQLGRPSRTNPPVDSSREFSALYPVNEAVKSTLQRSCNDCHSNHTVWPWYSNLAPASWLVAHDVNEGRKAMNFSDWSAANGEDNRELVAKICEDVSQKEMPPYQYMLLHPDAKVSSSEAREICSWTAISGRGDNRSGKGK